MNDPASVAAPTSQLGYATSAGEMRQRLEVILPDSDYLTFVAERQREAVGVIGVGICRY